MAEMRRSVSLVSLLLLSLMSVCGQETRDSLVRLLSADRARLVEIGGVEYRKVVGHAVFFHNNTYLKCDSAYWNVNGQYIDAVGRVRIEQENTMLTGDSLRYVIHENTAKFRGHLVQLMDRDSNVLRTNYLDYNTKDSVATFFKGGAMRDSSGNIIESMRGRYESRIRTFEFVDRVEMFSDSMFFKCDRLVYDSRSNVADFYGNTEGWYDVNHISSGAGWYDRGNEKLFFRDDVHILTEDYELWCDTLNYDRMTEFSHLLGNVQLTDTVDNVVVLGGELFYWNDPRKAEVYRDPALVLVEENEAGERDSVFMAADMMRYYTQRMFEVDSAVTAAARQRYEDALVDPLAPPPSASSTQTSTENKTAGKGMSPDSSAVQDSLSISGGGMPGVTDSLAVQDSVAVDSAAVQLDTTEVSFVEAYHNVRIYRNDMQVRCDSMLFSSLDSIARLYVSPVIWYETKTQITADSMQFLIRNETLDKGLLFSNAFVISEEEAGRYYHQIKSPEMTGYFKDGQISRFDALGGVTAMFYVSEDSVITTMNQKECRLMTGRMKDGQVQRVLYNENVKSDAYPVRELTPDMMQLRDFNWKPDQRPDSRYSVTARPVRASIRNELVPSPYFPQFRYTEQYFSGYMKSVMSEIERRKPLIWIGKE